MITATQEKVIPAPGRHGLVYVDTVILAHSNEAEWQKFKADHTNEAILDRIVVVKVPYNLRLSEEVKIYQKIIRLSDVRAHVAPHTLEIASMFAILSRLEPNAKCDLVTKLKLYNGEEVVEKGKTKKIDVQELREDAKREGMSGISTRFIMKALDNALSDNVEGNCINPINVREALINMVKEAIEKKLMTSVRDISRIITKARTRDEEQTQKYNAMVKNLLDSGYCESCVDVVLKYAANNLWKD